MSSWIASHALAILVFAAIAFVFGRAIVWRFLPECPTGQRIAFSIALGNGLLSTAFFILGITGSLTRVNIYIVLGVAATAVFVPIRGSRFAITRDAALLIAGTTTSFLLALYPPVGFDATLYHLPYARLFATHGALAFADTLRFPVFPQLGEMTFAAALLVADDVTAQLTQWLALVVTTIAIASFAREVGGRATSFLAVALWIGSPLALYLGANAYIDASLTMYVTLAFIAWHRWKSDERAIGWIVLAGVFAGCAAATKYHGLFFVVLLGAGLLARFRRASQHGDGVGLEARRWRARCPALLAFTCAALLFAAPWYARIAKETGNPVFPYASAIFGRHEWQTKLDASVESIFTTSLQSSRTPTPASIARRAILDRIARGEAPHNPWLVLLLPFAVAAAFVDRRLRFPIVAAFIYAIAVSALDWRFMIVITPILSVSIAIGLIRTWVAIREPRGIAIAALILAAPGLGWTSLLLQRFGAIPTNPTTRDAFIEHRVPLYDALRFVGRERPNDAVYVLHAENAVYYCPSRCLGELYGPYRYAIIDPLLAHPAQLAQKLRQFGVRVIVRHRGDGPPLDDSGAFRLLYRSERSEAFAVD